MKTHIRALDTFKTVTDETPWHYGNPITALHRRFLLAYAFVCLDAANITLQSSIIIKKLTWNTKTGKRHQSACLMVAYMHPHTTGVP
jgi:hypothetical protein